MNRDDIIRMAREAGLYSGSPRTPSTGRMIEKRLEHFAALVAAAERKRIESTPWGAGKEWIARAVEAEREACADICDKFQARDVGMQPAECAAAIRARGEK